MAKRKKKASTKKSKCCSGYLWAFNLAWILAIILAFGGIASGTWVTMPIWSLILVILGLITGFIYKTSDMTPLVLIAIALTLFGGSSLSAIPYVGNLANIAINNFTTFLAPAAIIVMLRKIFEIFK
ncbi:hypothetical protein K8R33_03500 [archaeon]|nr:hypothetical protein [archaeon]